MTTDSMERRRSSLLVRSSSFVTKNLFQEYRSSILLGITFAGGFLCLLALMYDSNLENSKVGDAVRHGPLFRIVVVAAIALACPNIMNNIADYVGYLISKKPPINPNKNKNKKIPILSTYEKFVFIVGILILPIVSSCCQSWNKAILLTGISTGIQQQFVGGVIITSFNRFDRMYFPTSVTYILILLLTATSVAKAFATNACASLSQAECSATRIGGFNLSGSFIVISVEFVLVSFWLSSVYVKSFYGEKVHAQYYRWPTWCGVQKGLISKEDKGPKITVQDNLSFFRAVYGLTVIVWIVFVLIARYAINYTNFARYDDQNLMLNFVPYLVFEFWALFVALRLVKHETVSALLIAIDAKNALIDAKKTYVRYISHELRTPLSAANSGLQMLHAELSQTANSTNPIDVERLDTLTDVCTAINTTVNILDDLLTFEKMESGLMQLHLEEVNVESFVDNCVSIFHTPARGKNIDIKMELCDPSVESSLPVDSTDLLSIDKFKMSQVLRNFMSNALKFTPNGGTITVRACFIPDKFTSTKIKEQPNEDDSSGLSIRSLSSRFIQSLRVKPPTSRVVADLESGRLKVLDIGKSGGGGSGDNGSNVLLDGTHILKGMLRVSIQDTGAGMSTQNQQRLFKEIIQFNPEVLQGGGGSGFGLFICKGISDLHRGIIEVFSEGEGKGTTFSISLPMRRRPRNPLLPGLHVVSSYPRLLVPSRGPSRASSLKDKDPSNEVTLTNNRQVVLLPPLEHPLEQPTISAVQAENSSPKSHRDSRKSAAAVALSYRSDVDDNGKKYKILVVDDSPLNRKMLLKLLKSKGHQIEEAADGQIAVDKVKKEAEAGRFYDVILMDFVMPEMTGPEATKSIRSMGIKTPVFGVTGNALESDVTIFLAAGADIILIKPFSIAEFYEAMRTVAATSTN